MFISNKDFQSILEIFKKNKILATKELSTLVSKLISLKKEKEKEKDSYKEPQDEKQDEKTQQEKNNSEENTDEAEQSESKENDVKSDSKRNNKQEASKVSSSNISENNVKNIFKSISIEIDKLKTQLLKYEKFLYQREQIEEAAAAEAYIEGRNKKEFKSKGGKKEKVNSSFLKLLGFTLFALTPLIMGFLRNFDFQKIKSFFEKDLKENIMKGIETFFSNFAKKIKNILVENVIDPVKKYLSKTISGIWDSAVEIIQSALSMFNIELTRKVNEESKIEEQPSEELNFDKEIDKVFNANASASEFYDSVSKFMKDEFENKKKDGEDCECEEPQSPTPAPSLPSNVLPSSEEPQLPSSPQDITPSQNSSSQELNRQKGTGYQPSTNQSIEISKEDASRIPDLNKQQKDAKKEKTISTDSISGAIGGSEAGGSYDLAFGDRISKNGEIINVNDSITAEQFSNGKKLSEMTLQEVFAFQEARDNIKKGTSAVGKYQFIKSTLAGLVKKLNLPMDTLFNSETQEKLQQSLLDENKNILQKKGVPLTPGYLYMAHYIGGGGAIAVYNAAQRGEDITVAQAIVNAGYKDPSANNRELTTIKVSDFENILASRMEKHGAPPSTQIAQSDNVPKQIVPSEKISGLQVSKLSEDHLQAEEEINIIQNKPASEGNAQASYTPPKAGSSPMANRNNSAKKNSINLYEKILEVA